jgi:hypothetical protein
VHLEKLQSVAVQAVLGHVKVTVRELCLPYSSKLKGMATYFSEMPLTLNRLHGVIFKKIELFVEFFGLLRDYKFLKKCSASWS